MKNLLFLQCKTTLKNIPAMRNLVIMSLLFISSQTGLLYAQDAKLSVQGILKKASGEAVPDGSYSLTFRLYTSPTATINQNIWIETQNAVDVVSGIYSTVLGNTVPLDVAFDTDYYLGVTVGSTEMTPRIELTSAPYALSIRGENNKFPSSGQVVADSIDVNGNVLTQQGAPGLNGVNKNGYGFLGDKDSGLYSLAAGQVSLYVNNVEEVKVRPDSVVINGELRPENIRLDNEGKVSYNGLNDWRLVYDDNFQNGNNALGWQVYNKLPQNEYFGWNNPTAFGNAPISGDVNQFQGRYLYPANNDQVLKKFYDLTGVGPYNYIKVKFKYFFIDSWNGRADNPQDDSGWAAFAESAAGNQFRLGWVQSNFSFQNYNPRMSTTAFVGANKWEGNSINTEQCQNYEMTAYKDAGSNGFWLMFGNSMDASSSDERYGVGMIEIWVK